MSILYIGEANEIEFLLSQVTTLQGRGVKGPSVSMRDAAIFILSLT